MKLIVEFGHTTECYTLAVALVKGLITNTNSILNIGKLTSIYDNGDVRIISTVFWLLKFAHIYLFNLVYNIFNI